MNVFLIGDVRSAYRVEYFIRTCLSDKKYHIFVNDLQATGIYSRFIKKMASLVALRSADVVFVALCQHNSVLVKAAVKLGKPIITDFYISFYDTEVFDRNHCSANSKKAKKWKKIDLFAMRNSYQLFFFEPKRSTVLFSGAWYGFQNGQL